MQCLFVSTSLEVCIIDLDISLLTHITTIEEILEEVRHMETAQKAINMHMRSSHTSSGVKSSQG